MADYLIGKYSLGGNWVDLVFALLIIYFILTAEGFLPSFLDLLSFVVSFIFSFQSYPFFGQILIDNFSLSRGMSNALGFFIAWLAAEIVFFTMARLALRRVPEKIAKNRLNAIFGFVPATVQAIIFFTFLLTLIIALPLRGEIKQDILNSKTGPYLVEVSQNLESSLRQVFKDAAWETLNFLTIKPTSQEAVDLGFDLTEADLTIDQFSEIQMFNLMNRERLPEGLRSLSLDQKLTAVARQYAREMLLNGFFSHYSRVDGSSPADRLEEAGVDYFVTGENLAFAPDVTIAHTGLINSPGHKKNILSAEFAKVGIGVIDAGIFGKMFVQQFTN